jgi:hypothetical protein
MATASRVVKPIRKILHSEFVTEKEVFHFAKSRVDSTGPFHWHTHDYDEIFVIESGVGKHHINQKVIPISAGDLVLMRASDRHTFSGSALVIANLFFPPISKRNWPSVFLRGDIFFMEKAIIQKRNILKMLS